MKNTTVLLVVALLPALALANGYDVPSVTPRDLALVESGTAAQLDAGATFANPSALSRVRGLSLNVAGSLLDLKTDWSAPAGSSLAGSPDASTKFMPVPPVALYAAYGFQLLGRSVGVGAGMNVPGGGNMYWQDDWAGRGRIITVNRKVYGFYATAGAEVVDGLRLGGGLVYYYTTEYLKQGVQPFPSAYGELATTGGAPSFDLSAEYAVPTLPLTVGLDYKHQAVQKLTGDGNFVVPDAMLSASPPPIDQGVTHVLTYPNVLNAGVAYQPFERLRITGVYTFTRYKVYRDDTFVGDRGLVLKVPRNYGNGHTFRFGAEYALDPRVSLRAGLMRDVSGFRSDTYSPTLPDSSSWCGGLGAGWWIRRDLSLDAGMFYARMDQVTTTGTVALPGVYDARVFIYSLGATWRTDLVAAK